MECKGFYYKLIAGKLICQACGKTPEEHRKKIEDKIAPGGEDKMIPAPENKSKQKIKREVK